MTSITHTSSTFVAARAAGYELQMGRWSRRLAAEFVDFVGVGDGERVLDVGCRSADEPVTDTWRRPGCPYVEHAARTNGDPRLRFSVGDACALDFPDHAFDRVLSLLALHFVPTPLAAIGEMRRVARPGAVVGAAVWDLRGGMVAGRLFFDTAAALIPPPTFTGAALTRPLTRPGELALAWRSTGLADVVEATLAIRMDYSGFDDYWSPYEGRDGPGAEYVATLTSENGRSSWTRSARLSRRRARRPALLRGSRVGREGARSCVRPLLLVDWFRVVTAASAPSRKRSDQAGFSGFGPKLTSLRHRTMSTFQG